MSRYKNMTGGYSLYEAGQVIGAKATEQIGFTEETRRLLDKAGIKPSGGTLEKPRFDRTHVDQLGAIRSSQKKDNNQ